MYRTESFYPKTCKLNFMENRDEKFMYFYTDIKVD